MRPVQWLYYAGDHALATPKFVFMYSIRNNSADHEVALRYSTDT